MSAMAQIRGQHGWNDAAVTKRQREESLAQLLATEGREGFARALLPVVADLSPERLHEVLAFAADCVPPPPGRKIVTIAFFYHRYNCGGIERVVSEQFGYFIAAGFRCVLITEDPPSDRDFPLPDGVVREIVPVDPVRRLSALKEIFDRRDVDLYYSHCSFAKQTLWDLLIVRFILDRRMLVHAHGIFPCSLVWGELDLARRLDLYRLSDRLIVLSRADEVYYRSQGVPAKYLPNPITRIPLQEYDWESRRAKRRVLVIGRIQTVKRTLDALKAAKVLAAIDSTIKFLIVGSHENASYWRQIQSFYRANGLGPTVDFMDYTLDVAKLYREGSMLLLTSQIEGYPMVLAEAKGFALPVVSYDLPFVELQRGALGEGAVIVDHGDFSAAAMEIKRVLDDPIAYRDLGERSRKAYETMIQACDLVMEYRNVIHAMEGDLSAGAVDEHLESVGAAFASLIRQLPLAFDLVAARQQAKMVQPSPSSPCAERSRSLPQRLLKCYFDNGFAYTLKRMVRKMFFR